MSAARPALFAVVACSVILSARAASPAEGGSKESCIHAAERGQQLRATRRLVEARDQFIACAADVCPAMIRKDCAQWLADAEARVPTVVFAAKDPANRDVTAVRILEDGKPVAETLDGASIPVNPGAHVFRYEATGHPPLDQQIVIREAEKGRLIQVTLAGARAPAAPAPSSASSGVPTGVWVLGGIGVLGGAAFAALGAWGKSDVDAMRATCAPSCSESGVDAARNKVIAADVALGIGAVSLGLAGVLLVTRSTDGRTTGLSVRPTRGGGAAMFVATF